MEGLKQDIKETGEIFEEYLKTELDLFKVELIEKSSRVIASTISALLLAGFVTVPILFGFMALGFYFGELFDSYAAGFGLVAGVVVVLYVAAIVARKFLLKNPIQDHLIKTFAKSLFEEENAGKEGDKDQ